MGHGPFQEEKVDLPDRAALQRKAPAELCESDGWRSGKLQICSGSKLEPKLGIACGL